MAVTEEEVHAISAGDIDRYLAILTENATFMPPNLPPRRGDELRQWLRDFLERFTVEYLEFVHGETVVVGNLAYHEFTCSWKTTPRSGGPPAVAHFKGMHILRKDPNGAWKLARGIWNSSPAPAEGA
jgi:ketosteroid isomerase-like protein